MCLRSPCGAGQEREEGELGEETAESCGILILLGSAALHVSPGCLPWDSLPFFWAFPRAGALLALQMELLAQPLFAAASQPWLPWLLAFVWKWQLCFLQGSSSLLSAHGEWIHRFPVCTADLDQHSLDQPPFLQGEEEEKKNQPTTSTVDSGFDSVNTTVLQNEKLNMQPR